MLVLLVILKLVVLLIILKLTLNGDILRKNEKQAACTKQLLPAGTGRAGLLQLVWAAATKTTAATATQAAATLLRSYAKLATLVAWLWHATGHYC